MDASKGKDTSNNRNAYNSMDAILNWNVCNYCWQAVRHIKEKWDKEHCEAFSLSVRHIRGAVPVYSIFTIQSARLSVQSSE
jgi:hypothetical protein